MKSKISLVITLMFVVLATTQCKKKTAEEPHEHDEPTPTGINTVAEIITANGAAANTVTVDAVNASTINVHGTIIEIPANAFVTATSGTVGGVVSLTVKTILTKSQIIFSGAGANSSNSRLVSTKGCVKATASQNTQSLRLGSGGFFVNIPDPSSVTPPPNKKYYAPKVTATDSTAIWALGTDVADITQRTFPLSATVYHHASLDSLKWLNVGVQFDSVPATKVPVTVNIDGTKFTKANTMVFISFNNSLTVGALFEISNGVFRISNMPQGKGVHIVGISVINGQYYAATLSTTISSTPINLTMNPVSQTVMKNMVAALP
jgi:hypothetical protein